MSQSPRNTNIFLRLPAVRARIGLSRSTIYSKINPDSPQFDSTFPSPIKLSSRAIGFSADAIDAWVESKLNGGVA